MNSFSCVWQPSQPLHFVEEIVCFALYCVACLHLIIVQCTMYNFNHTATISQFHSLRFFALSLFEYSQREIVLGDQKKKNKHNNYKFRWLTLFALAAASAFVCGHNFIALTLLSFDFFSVPSSAIVFSRKRNESVIRCCLLQVTL